MLIALLTPAFAGCGPAQTERVAPVPTVVAEAPPPLPRASAVVVDEPSNTPPATASTTALAAPAPDPCRGGRLLREEVEELCRTSKTGSALPSQVNAEIHGPERVKPGEEAAYELRLVNTSDETLSFAFSYSCSSALRATDATGANVIRYESTSLAETVSSCSAERNVVAVVLEPGGMIVEPVAWRARGEHHRDGKLIKRQSLPSGKYKLSATTWLRRGPAGEDAPVGPGRHGVYTPVTANLSILVAP